MNNQLHLHSGISTHTHRKGSRELDTLSPPHPHNSTVMPRAIKGKGKGAVSWTLFPLPTPTIVQ